MEQHKTNLRKSNIEVLRILAALLIVMHHFSVHGFGGMTLSYNFNKLIVDFFAIGGKVGVNLFVFIMGYFMIDSKVTPMKILKIVGEVWFYSVSIFLLFYFILTPDMSIAYEEGFHYFFPILYSTNWFATTYIYLLFVVPVLNILFKNMTQRQLKKLLIGALILCSLLPTILQSSYQLSDLGWFVVLYLLAAYLKKYSCIKGSWKKHFLISVLLYFILWGMYMYSGKWIYQNSILAVLIVVELFISVTKMKPFYNKWINLAASATFGVYLIHDNRLMRPYLWFEIFQTETAYAYNKKEFLLFAVIAVSSIYIVCTIVDLLRQCTVEKIWVFSIHKFVLPKIEKMQKLGKAILKDMMNQVSSILSGTFQIRHYFWLVIPVLLTVCAAVFGSVSLWFTVGENKGIVESLYVCARYAVNLLYLMFPLFLVICYVVRFVRFTLKNYGYKRTLCEGIIRFLCGMTVTLVVFLIQGYGYRTLVQNFMRDNWSEYLFWCLILFGYLISFTNRTFLQQYIERQENSSQNMKEY